MSDQNDEWSEGGSQIFRHTARDSEWTAPEHPAEHLEEIDAHIEKYIGKIDWVYHEIISDLIHLDVLVILATKDRPFHILVTSGVSDEPMNVPDDMEEFNRVELMIALPAEWSLTDESFKSEANYWPIRWLKMVGRLPHEYETWIGWGHTIPNGDPPEPIADTAFVGVMLAPPYELSPQFFRLITDSGAVISFLTLIPLYKEEMDLKLRKGADELENSLEKQGVSFVVDKNRPNAAKKKGWFGR